MKKVCLILISVIFLIGCSKKSADAVGEVEVGAGHEVEIAPGFKVKGPAASRLMCECACQYGVITY